MYILHNDKLWFCKYAIYHFELFSALDFHSFFIGGKKAVEIHAAVWVPDNEATICMHCNKTQFTVLNRRVIKINL